MDDFSPANVAGRVDGVAEVRVEDGKETVADFITFRLGSPMSRRMMSGAGVAAGCRQPRSTRGSYLDNPCRSAALSASTFFFFLLPPTMLMISTNILKPMAK